MASNDEEAQKLTSAREVVKMASNDEEAQKLTSRSAHTDGDESGTEAEALSSKRNLGVAALAFVLAATAAALVCSMMYRNAVTAPVDSFVSLSSEGYAPVAEWIKPKPELCNIGVVLDFCMRLNQMSPDVLSKNPHSSKAAVTASTLSDYFMASQSSVTSFLERISAQNIATKNGTYKVSCEQLCQKTMASFAVHQLPPMVDVGCYYQPPAALPTCAVDVALSVLAHTELPKGSAKKLGHQFLEDGSQELTAQQEEDEKVLDAMDETPEYAALSHPDVSFGALQLSAARLFRTFPASNHVSLDITTSDITTQRLWDDGTTERKLWDDSCATAHSGTCDVPFSCADGTDCTDCGTCGGRVPDDSCRYGQDDHCDEPRYCMVGTDCTDCDTCGLGGDELMEKIRTSKPNDSCETASDGTCDDSCEKGTDCTDCNTCHWTGKHFAPAQYDHMLLQANSKVQALLTSALIGVASGAGSKILLEFIGKDDDQIREELKRVIAGLSRMLDNIEYVYPGQACKEDTYGYIEVDKPPSGSRSYTMNLCKAFMEGNPYERYMTLLHNGVRAAPMLAETAVLDGQPVYGEDMVKQLAVKCKSDGGSACKTAVRNAQNIVHVIKRFVKLAL